MPEPVTVRVPAKINLYLEVGPLRSDGYHEIVTIFHAVSLYDEVTATPARELSVTIRGEGEGEIPLDRENFAWQAASLIADRVDMPARVRLDVLKGIPLAGGLAGGSADGAGALVACDALFDAGLERDELVELAAQVGSDMPFSLMGGTALGTGRGERLMPTLAAGRWHWVLAFASGGLSTPQIYREFDRLREEGGTDGPPRTPNALIEALRSRDPARLGPLLHNDLQPAALSIRPDLRRTLDAGLELGALGGVVCGSGPTCAFLARSAEAAVRLAAALAGAGVARTVRVVHGPVSGARVVED